MDTSALTAGELGRRVPAVVPLVQPPSEISGLLVSLVRDVLRPAAFAVIVAGVLVLLFVQARSRVRR